jgi:hypothetical protein
VRTTVTLDPDADAIVRRLMKERGLSFKQAINAAIRGSETSRTRRNRFRTTTFDLGSPAVPLDKALRLAAELEDESLTRKLAERK